MKQNIKILFSLLAAAIVSLSLLSACGTEYDYSKSDATKYDRPDVDRDPSNNDDKSDDQDADGE